MRRIDVMAGLCDSLEREAALDAAKQSHEAGDWVEAARWYRQLLHRQPRDPDLLQQFGRLCHDVGNHQEAIDLLANAIKHVADGTHKADCQSDLAEALLADGQVIDALAACELARDLLDGAGVEITPRLFLLQADAFHRLGESEEAINVLREAAEQHSDHSDVRMALGRALQHRGDVDAAVAEFEYVLLHQPQHVAAVLCLTELMLQGTVSIGLPWIQRMRMTIPYAADDRQRIQMRFALAHVHHRRGEQDEAEAAYRHANRDQFHKMAARPEVMTVDRLVSFVDRQIAFFTPQRIEDLQHRYGAATTQPMFVVGLPGTDPIAWVQKESRRGEIAVWERPVAIDELAAQIVGQGAYPAACRDAPPSRWNAARAAYLDSMRLAAPFADRVANATALNSLYIGLLAILFPHARTVHCVRSNEQAAVRRYYRQTRFDDCLATADLASIQQASGHLQRLMQHWQMVTRLETVFQ